MRTFTYQYIRAAGSISGLPLKTRFFNSSTSLLSEYSPSGDDSFGAYHDRLPPSSGDFSYSIPRRLVSSPFRPSSSTLPSVSAAEYSRAVGYCSDKKKSELYQVQDIQFLGVHLRLDLGRAFHPESKAWEIIARACELSSQQVLSYQRVAQFMDSLNWALGLIPLGYLHLRPLQRHFHSLDLMNWFTPLRRSHQPALASLLQKWQDLSFLTSGIPI